MMNEFLGSLFAYVFMESFEIFIFFVSFRFVLVLLSVGFKFAKILKREFFAKKA